MEPQDAVSVARLKRFALIVNVLDQAFRVPGTRWRFGLDGILGLIPGVGDITTAVVGSYGLVLANQLGAPASIQLRMLLNLTVDAVLGAIPLFGDLFDFAFKSHSRNARLLEGWLSRPHATRRSSSFVLVGVLAAFLAIAAGAVWLAFLAARALYHLVAGAWA
jgi:hypothetical protein